MNLINLSIPKDTQPRLVVAEPDAALPSARIHPDVHLFETALGPHVLVVNGSQVYGLGQAEYARLLTATQRNGEEYVEKVLGDLGLDSLPAIDDSPVVAPPIRALSLAVAQKCNLGCTYCYAQEGNFGGPSKQM